MEMTDKVRVTVWGEYRHEKEDPRVAKIYPDGMHVTIADFLGAQPDIETRTATLDETEHGLSERVLGETDVLVWWGHKAHGEVDDISADVETTLARNEKGRWRIGGIKVNIKAVMDEENQKKFERCRELYEDFCIVTGSVRHGVDVDVDLSVELPE